MGLNVYLALTIGVFVIIKPGSGQITAVVVDCTTNVASQDVLLTITGTVGSSVPPTYVSVEGCAGQFAISTGVATVLKATCTGINWNEAIVVTIQEFENLALETDAKVAYTCTLDTASQAVTGYVTASSTATEATYTGKITPTLTLSLGTNADCSAAAPAYVNVGTTLYICVELGANFITTDGFDIKISDITAAGGAGVTITLTSSGCTSTTYTFWPTVTYTSQGKLALGPFKAFMFSNIAALIDYVKFELTVQLCAYDPALPGCGGYDCDSDGTADAWGRKRRSLANITEIQEEITLETSIQIAPEGMDINGLGEQDKSVSDDDVCIQKGGFYGLVVFFILGLLLAVSASCYLFVKARKSHKYVDERYLHYTESNGSQNPSFYK